MRYVSLITIVLLVVVMSNFVSAETYPVNKDVNLTQTCQINSVPQTNAIGIISIQPLGGGLLVNNATMTNEGNGNFFYNYSFPFQSVYILNYLCVTSNLTWGFSPSVNVNYSGTEPSTAQGLIYIILVVVNLVFLLLTLYGAITVDGKNGEDDRGLIHVNYQKYLKIFFGMLTYMMLTWFAFNLWNLSENFLVLGFMTSFFRPLATFLLSAMLPVSLIVLTFTVIWLFIDQRFQDMFQRGIPGSRY